MFLPVGDYPNPRSTPYANYLLIAANVAVWLLVSLPLIAAPPDLNDPVLLQYLQYLGARGPVPAQAILEQLSAYDLFVFKYGYRPADPSPLTLFSSLFLHGGWMHLIGNMLFLFIFGDNVEHRLGHGGYLLGYLATGVVATLFFAMFVPGSETPLVGASGAISGVLGCYFLWFPRNTVKVFVFLFPFIMNTFMIPSRLVLGFYLVIDNVLPFLFSAGGAGGGGVAHGAHIGGFVGGLGLAWGLERLPRLKLWRAERKFQAEESAPDPQGASLLNPAALVHHHLRNDRPRQAAALFLRMEQRRDRQSVESEDVIAVGDYLLEQGRDDLALPVFRRFIAERPDDFCIDRAFLGAGRSLLRHSRQITSAYQYFLQALETARSEATRTEARMHLRAIERLGEK